MNASNWPAVAVALVTVAIVLRVVYLTLLDVEWHPLTRIFPPRGFQDYFSERQPDTEVCDE